MSERKKGSTGVTLEFRLADATTGAAISGVDVTTLKLQYKRPGASPSTATSLTLKATFATAWAAFAAKESDATNSKGVYDVDCPDTCFTTGADEVAISISGTAIETSTRLVDLVGIDTRNATSLGLTNLDAAVSTRLATSGYTVPPTSAVIAAAAWDLATSGHTTSGTFGAAMNAAGSAGDPWATSLPGVYGAGTAGNIVGNQIDAAISTRSIFAGGAVASVTGAVGSVTAPVTTTSNIKKNQALNAFPFTMRDSNNHILTAGFGVTATRSLDGGAFSACANTPTSVGNGAYKINLASTDTNANTLMLRFSAAGADDTMIGVVTQP